MAGLVLAQITIQAKDADFILSSPNFDSGRSWQFSISNKVTDAQLQAISLVNSKWKLDGDKILRAPISSSVSSVWLIKN